VATFIPPQRGNRGWVNDSTPEWQRAPFKFFTNESSPPYSANVFKLNDGTYTETQPTDPTRIAITYYGGHEYEVSAAEVAALTAAGYGASIH